MFGAAVQIVLILYAILIIRRIIKFVRKSKKWGKDYEALLWSRAVVDPEGPRRIRQADIYKYRFNKKPKPVYTGKHPKLHKGKKWFVAINVILIALLLIAFNLSAIRGIFSPTTIETETEIVVISVSNLVEGSGFVGQYYDLVGTDQAQIVHPQDEAYMRVRIFRTDTADESRNIVLTVASNTFDDNETAYVEAVEFNGMVYMNSTDNRTFTISFNLARGEFVVVGVLFFFREFPNEVKTEYLSFQATGTVLSSIIHISGGPPSMPIPR